MSIVIFGTTAIQISITTSELVISSEGALHPSQSISEQFYGLNMAGYAVDHQVVRAPSVQSVPMVLRAVLA